LHPVDTTKTEKKPYRPELLAPAGNWEAVKAACANGADAIYFGLSAFNARLRAENFGDSDLPALMEYLHQRNVRGYLTLNTLIYQHELAEAGRLIAAAAAAGVDAFIVQDAGLAAFAARIAPTLALHASTQMTLSTPDAVANAELLGISRVILPRELPLSEIRRIADSTSLELEVFVHGALCISYSGQCQASLVLGGRSANRGECAQPCRLPYKTLIDGVPLKDNARQYPLSPCDLAAWKLVPELVAMRIKGFKIEGRLKNACYVAAAVRLYRAAIDAALEGRAFTPDAADEAALRQTFSRGFSTGFLGGAGHVELVDGLTPKPRGVRMGTVIEVRPHTLLIHLESDSEDYDALLKPGDGVVFASGPDAERTSGGRIESVRSIINRGAKAGQCGRALEIALWNAGERSLDIPVGAMLWKTDDPQQEKRLKASYSQEKIYQRTPLTVRAEAMVGQPLRLLWLDIQGHCVELSSDEALQRAEHQALTLETLSEQLGRLGDTPFTLGAVELIAPEAVMVPKSTLNNLRREAVNRLLELRRASAVHTVTPGDTLDNLQRELHPATATDAGERLSVLARTAEQARALLQTANDRDIFVWLDLERLADNGVIAAEFHAAGRPFGLATPRITRTGEENRLETLLTLKPAALLLRSCAALAFYARRASGIELAGDAFLHTANAISTGLLLREGLNRLTPAYELSPDDIIRLAAASDPGRIEIPIYARLPMFHTEHCLFATETGTNAHSGEKCAASCCRVKLELLDRKGAHHRVLTDESCRNTVYSSAPRDWRNELARLRAAGLRNFRIELLTEDAVQTVKLLDSIRG